MNELGKEMVIEWIKVFWGEKQQIKLESEGCWEVLAPVMMRIDS